MHGEWACRVRQTVLAQGAGRAHAFTLRTEQLRVTTAESFWRCERTCMQTGDKQ